MSDLPNVGGFVLDHMIVAAERTLVDYAANPLLPIDMVHRFKWLVVKMHHERRIFLEDMMQLPFQPVESNV